MINNVEHHAAKNTLKSTILTVMATAFTHWSERGLWSPSDRRRLTLWSRTQGPGLWFDGDDSDNVSTLTFLLQDPFCLVWSLIRPPVGKVTDRAYWPPLLCLIAVCVCVCVCVCMCVCGPVSVCVFTVCGVCSRDVWAHAALIRPLIPGCFKAAALWEWNETL